MSKETKAVLVCAAENLERADNAIAAATQDVEDAHERLSDAEFQLRIEEHNLSVAEDDYKRAQKADSDDDAARLCQCRTDLRLE